MRVRQMVNSGGMKIGRLAAFGLLTGIILCISLAGNVISAGTMTWTRASIPAQGEPGHWVLANGSDLHHLTEAADGTIYAYGAGLAVTLYRSDDHGAGWTAVGNVDDSMVAIAVSPQDPAVIYYATQATIYRSTNGGATFGSLPPNPGNTGQGNLSITSLAVSWADSQVIAVGTADADSGEFGGVYLLDEGTGTYIWEDTGIGSLDVYAVAFSPNFSADRQIVAVATDETDTYIIQKQGFIPWNTITGTATLNQDNAVTPVSVSANSATIGFPDNYSSNTASARCILFIAVATGTGDGDIYRVRGIPAPRASTATDLNAGLATSQANLDTSGLGLYGAYPSVSIITGAGNEVFTSDDGGESWARCRKTPSGTAVTSILYPRHGTDPETVYISTAGPNSGFSVSHDSGDTWNQSSFVDTALTDIIDTAPSPDYNQDKTLFLLTFGGGGHSLWRTSGDGWERILSSGILGVTTLSLAGLPPGYGGAERTVFCAGDSGGIPAIWESTDNGQTFNRRPTRDPVTGNPFTIDTWAIADDTTLFIGAFDGVNGIIYRTGNRGYYYAEGIVAGTQLIISLAVSPGFNEDETILAGTGDGRVYRSQNSGLSFRQLPFDAVTAPLSGTVSIDFDPAYPDNGIVYAAGDTADTGIHRFRTGTGINWEMIDATLPAGGMINGLTVTDNGILYAANSAADDGLERCLTPGLDSGTAFNTFTRGLEDGAMLNGLWQSGDYVWSVDTANNRLVRLEDTLARPVGVASPPGGATGIGTLSDHAVTQIALDWDPLEGATGYEWQCDDDTGFSALAAGMQGNTTGNSVFLPVLQPSMTYFWRVRASAPVTSPWSDTREFNTPMDTEAVTLLPELPTPGAAGVPLQPVFRWTAMMGADAYELLVAPDIGFDQPVITRTGDYALPGNAWESDLTLEPGKTYYWKLRAVTGNKYSPWSSSGIFTTAAAAIPGPDADVPETPPEQITPDGTIKAFTQVEPDRELFPPEPEATGIQPQTTPVIFEQQSIPNWAIYFIGALLAVIMLTLLVLLTVVVKTRLR